MITARGYVARETAEYDRKADDVRLRLLALRHRLESLTSLAELYHDVGDFEALQRTQLAIRETIAHVREAGGQVADHPNTNPMNRLRRELISSSLARQGVSDVAIHNPPAAACERAGPDAEPG